LPTYNEEVAIGSVVLRTRKYADSVIVVDDGSLDHTAEVAAMVGAALKTGFLAAGGMDEPRSCTTKARNVEVPNKKRLDGFASIFSLSFFINITRSIFLGAWIP
jgi:glycosyltransferase involved in cell wall biosynthesis